MPFRWPKTNQDIFLSSEVLGKNPSSPSDWEGIAQTLVENLVIKIKSYNSKEELAGKG
jgi:hypothetical protein